MDYQRDLGKSNLVGRLIPNAFGQKETVVLYPKYWVFYDWCVDQGLDMEEWCKYLDIHRKQESTFSEAVYFDLWRYWCSRHKQGLICPTNSAPDFYEDFLNDLDAGEFEEILPNDVAAEKNGDEILHIPVINSKEMSEIISLPRKYWLHFEYLYIKGENTKLWIKELDSQRLECKTQNEDLTDYFKNALVQSEKERFQKGEDMPLYITPEGYPK